MAQPEGTRTPTDPRQGDAVALQSGRRQDFTYRRLHGLRVRGMDLGRSLFIGALFEDCTFAEVDFSRSDLSGTKIVRCAFEDCRFSAADIRSCRFDEVRLRRCDFQSAQLSRTDLKGTNLSSCDFTSATILETALTECEMRDCCFEQASVTSLDFDRCSFIDTSLASCTALFLFFEQCVFERFGINAESVGLTYGLARRDLDRIELIHLGDAQPKPKGTDLVDLMLTSYRARRWFVGAATLELNFGLVPVAVSVRRLAGQLSKLAHEGLPCDLDELAFFERVLQRLARDGRLPLLASRFFGRALTGFLARPLSDRDDRLRHLIGRVDSLTLSLLDDACALVQGEPGDVIRVELRLTERPARPLDALCIDVLHRIHGPTTTLEFVSGRDGSWIEIWQTAPGVIATVQLILLAVNGLLKELNKAVEQARRLKKALKGTKASPTKAVTKRSGTQPTVAAADDGITAKIESGRRRASLLSDESLRRVDATLEAIEIMPDEAFIDWQAYAADKVLAVTVTPARRRRAPRDRAPAA